MNPRTIALILGVLYLFTTFAYQWEWLTFERTVVIFLFYIAVNTARGEK